MVSVSVDTVEDNSEYVLYRGTVETDSQTSISKLRDGEVSGGAVTLPITLDTGTTVETEELTFSVEPNLSADGGYTAKEDSETFLVLLWRDPDGGHGETLYVTEDEYAYNPSTIPDEEKEYAAYAEPTSTIDSLRFRVGRGLAPIVDNIKQSRLSNEWATVLRDDSVVEVAVDVDTPVKLAAVSVAVEIRIFMITREEVDGEQREVVKRFSYAPPFPVTAEGARIERDDGFSVVAPRCELDEITMRPFRVTDFS